MAETSWAEVLTQLRAGALDETSIRWAFRQILSGQASDAQTAALIFGMRVRGEDASELAAILDVMYENAQPAPLDDLGDLSDLVDTCGTGGDRSHSINVSTLASLVAASAGARVAKHGNRSASSDCGSADLLEALGVAIDLPGEGVAACIKGSGMGFYFARSYHPSMRFVGPVRQQLAVPTLFNFLGPLANPARVGRQFVGVSDATMAERMLAVLTRRGVTEAMVVWGSDGLDEITLSGPSTVLRYSGGLVSEIVIRPGDFGISEAPLEAIQGGELGQRVAAVPEILTGDGGPASDIVALNAGAILCVSGAVSTIADGVDIARKAMSDQRPIEVLRALVTISQQEAS